MGVVKSLIGSIVGAAVALGIYYGIKQSTGDTYIWFPLVIGVFVGIAARIAAGSSLSSGSRVVVGAVAAIIAGLAMFGPDVVEGMTGQSEFGPIESTSDRLINATIAKSDVEANKDDVGEEQGSGDKSDSGETLDATESGDGDSESGTADQDEGNSDDGEEDAPADDEAASDSTDSSDQADSRTIDVNQAFAERGKPEKEVPRSPETIKKFEELIKKQKHESWLATFLPIILSGVGMVLAYVIGQSGAAPAASKA